MDLTARISTIRQNATLAKDLLLQERFVVCFGQRATLCFFLAGHLSEQQVVGACTTASEAMACLEQQQASFLLCSDQLEQGCGIELVISAKQRWPGLRTLLLIQGRPAARRLRAAVDVGCDGLVLESSMGQGAATNALRTVCGGGIVVDRHVVTLLKGQGSCLSGVDQGTPELSSRELEVLNLLARGQSNAEIAATLIISLDTVKSHVKNLLLKLNAKGRTHAAVQAIELGLVDWPHSTSAR